MRFNISNIFPKPLVGFIFIPNVLFLTACGGGGGASAPADLPASGNYLPTASPVSITDDNAGSVLLGDVLTASYNYYDVEGDAEGASVYQWSRNGIAISGATSLSYTVVAADLLSNISFEVTAIAITGSITGETSYSSSLTVVNDAPVVSNVSIIDANGGNVLIGDMLTGSYSYADLEGDVEGATVIRWLRNGTPISGAASLNYTLVAADLRSLITLEVTPVALTGETTGSAVISNGFHTKKPFNDTGITTCGDFAYNTTGTDYDVTGSSIHNNNLDCSTQPVIPTQTSDGYDADGDIIRGGQDALYGRDVTHNDDNNGLAGFDFTQLDTSGTPLVAKSSDYNTTPWSCVKDNVTGLIWEVKKTTGLQSSTYTYTWYNSTKINDGGDHGPGDTGLGTTTYYATDPGFEAGSDNCADVARCDIEKYVVDVNASNGGAGICGANDWRLPSKHELLTIVNNNAIDPAIDTAYFPNTQASAYWTSSPYAHYEVSALEVDFLDGTAGYNPKGWIRHIRLVRNNK